MSDFLSRLCEKWLRVPPPPQAPPGAGASARIFLAAPGFLKYLRLRWAIHTVLSVIVGGVVLSALGGAILTLTGAETGGYLLVGLLVLVVALALLAKATLNFVLIQLGYANCYYVVTDSSLRIRHGVLTVHEVTFTFANIQNLSVVQGPIQRMFGISDLKVETAGGGSAEHPGHNLHVAHFRGIANPEELKELIATCMQAHRDSGLGDPVSAQSTAPQRPAELPLTDALQAVLAEAVALRHAATPRTSGDGR